MNDPVWGENLYGLADELLGPCGRILSGSKTAPPEMRVVWNGNVLVGKSKVWYGDISLRDSAPKLQELADRAGETVSVLREMDARFGSERNPDLSRAKAQYKPGDDAPCRACGNPGGACDVPGACG
jgi:hypothetical protein